MKVNFKQNWPVFLLVGLTVLFLGDIWFAGRMLLLRDFFWNDEPNRALLGTYLRSGTFPLWSSAWQCGEPNAAQPCYGTFYPPNWIFILPQVEWAIRLWWTFHLAVAAVAAYALARYWRLAVAPALFAAIGFAFSTYVVAWIEFAHGFCCMPWMPLVLLFVSRIIDRTAQESQEKGWAVLRKNAGSILALAAVLALQVLADVEYVYYSSLLVAGYGIAKWVWLRNLRVVGVSALLLGIAGLLALGLAMPQLILTLELVGQSVREGEVDAFLHIGSSHPRNWLSLLLPYLYGRPGYPAAYWAPKVYEFALGTCYVGILPLISLFFCGLWPKNQPAGERRFLIWFCITAVVAGLVMSAGQYTPVYPFLHHWLPGLGHLRFPTKFYLYVALALPLLGAFGFQALLENGGRKSPAAERLWWITVGCFGVFIFGYLLCLFDGRFLPWLMAHPGTPSAEQVSAVLFDYTLAVVLSVAGLILFGMLAFGRGRSQWVQAGIVAVAFANMCVISRQAHSTGPEGVYTRRPEELIKTIGKDPRYRFLSNYHSAQQYIYGDSRVEAYDWARNTGGSNHVLLEGIQDVATGCTVLGRYQQFFDILKSAPPQVSNKIADMMALRYVTGGEPFEQILWGNASPDVRLFDRSDCPPRALVVSQWKFVAEDDNMLKTILNDSFDPRKEAVLAPLPGEPATQPSGADETGGGEVRSLADHTDSTSMEVSSKGRSLLVLSDTWYPGWIATVDGVQRPIFRANYLFRGVFLEPGTHRVEFAYKPVRFTVGVWIFAFAATACAGLGWMVRGARRD